jgi:hypothetical protein
MLKSKPKYSAWFKTIAIGVVCLFLFNSTAYEASFVPQGIPAVHSLGIPWGSDDIAGLRNHDIQRIKRATVLLLREFLSKGVLKEGGVNLEDLREHIEASTDLHGRIDYDTVLTPCIYGTSPAGDKWLMRWWVKDEHSKDPRPYIAEFPKVGALEVHVYPEEATGETADTVPRFDKGIPPNFIEFYKEAWERKLREEAIGYDPRKAKREERRFDRNIILLNEGRALEGRRKIKSFEEVPEQVICEVLINGRWYQILVNKYPTFPYEGLFVRKNSTGTSHIMTEETVLDFLTFQREMPTSVHGAFSSRGAGFSVPDFHIKFHLSDHLIDGVDRLPVAEIPMSPHRVEGNVNINTLGDKHASSNLIFVGGDDREKSGVIGSYLTYVNDNVIPHNIIFLDDRIYLFLRDPEKDCTLVAAIANMGIWELYKRALFNRFNSHTAVEGYVRDTALSEVPFEKLKAKVAEREPDYITGYHWTDIDLVTLICDYGFYQIPVDEFNSFFKDFNSELQSLRDSAPRLSRKTDILLVFRINSRFLASPLPHACDAFGLGRDATGKKMPDALRQKLEELIEGSHFDRRGMPARILTANDCSDPCRWTGPETLDINETLRINQVLLEEELISAENFETLQASLERLAAKIETDRRIDESSAPQEITEILPAAERAHVGLVDKLSEVRTRVIVDKSMFKNGEFEKDITGHFFDDENRYIPLGDICDLEKCDTKSMDSIMETLKRGNYPAERTIVQVSGELDVEELRERLEESGLEGVEFMRVDTDALAPGGKHSMDLDKETRWKIRFSLYGMLIAARNITEEDLELKEASPAYRLLYFFLKMHGVSDLDTYIDPDVYIQAFTQNNLACLAKYALSFVPLKQWSKEARYYLISIRYIAGAA